MDLWTPVVAAVQQGRYYESPSHAIQALAEQGVNAPAATLCKVPEALVPLGDNSSGLAGCISREGDVLVGWYVRPEAEVAKSIGVRVGGDTHEHVVTVQPGQFGYCLRGTHPLCLINLQYVNVYVSVRASGTRASEAGVRLLRTRRNGVRRAARRAVDGDGDARDVVPVFAYFDKTSRQQLAHSVLLHRFGDDVWYAMKSHATLTSISGIGDSIKYNEQCSDWTNTYHTVPNLARRSALCAGGAPFQPAPLSIVFCDLIG